MHLHRNTLTALDRIAAAGEVSYVVRESEIVVDHGEFVGRSHIHLLDDGQWLVASWDETSQSYKSSHVPPSAGPTRYFAKTLDVLAQNVTTYRSAPAAMRAVLPADGGY